MAQALSNTKKAELNLYIQIAKKGFSYFDNGFEEGEGIWYGAMVEEMPNSRSLNARAITAAVKAGNLFKSDDVDDDGPWVGLTEQGAKLAISMASKPELLEELEIVEEAQEDKPRAEATKSLELTDRTCHCGCGANLTKKATYRPGHDSKHVSQLNQEIRKGRITQEQANTILLTEGLKAKLHRMLTK